jgi:hypothetical protein
VQSKIDADRGAEGRIRKDNWSASCGDNNPFQILERGRLKIFTASMAWGEGGHPDSHFSAAEAAGGQMAHRPCWKTAGQARKTLSGLRKLLQVFHDGGRAMGATYFINTDRLGLRYKNGVDLPGEGTCLLHSLEA